MQILKYFIMLLIFSSSTYIGVLFSKKYENREKQLKEMKVALDIFSKKIKFTYEPIPEIFVQISKQIKSNIGNIFEKASHNMQDLNASEAWKVALESSNTNLKREDLDVLKGLSNLLGKIDIEGQISEIELVNTFLDTQIKKAEEECKKNVKMYKTLGVTLGLAFVIILF